MLRWAIALVLAVFVALAVVRLLTRGPGSLRARYERDVAAGLARGASAETVTEAELAALPAAVQRYLRLTGAVGQPHVRNYHARFRGRIRSGPHAAWMPIEADQTSFVDPAARLFYLDATMFGLPVTGLHRYVGATATMQVKLLGAMPVVNAAGPEMDQGETVTLFNDMCAFAPATLLDPAIQWAEAGPDTVRATFTNAGHTVHAALVFNAAGELADFVSDDRFAGSPDGRSFTRERWSTPLRAYRAYGPHRLFSHAECRWHPAEGEFTYLELEMVEVEYNVGAGGRR